MTLIMMYKGSFFGPEIEVLINNLTNHHSLGAILISFDLLVDLSDVLQAYTDQKDFCTFSKCTKGLPVSRYILIT
jgi:hypothetical protein